MEQTMENIPAAGSGTQKAILIGGLGSGLLDILYACISSGLKGVSPDVIFKAISSGIFGRDAFTGGAGMVALGAFLHFGMTVLMAAIFVMAWKRMPILRAQPAISGLLYGVGIFLGMSYVVLPLSNYPGPAPINVGQFVAMVILVGLPIAFAARRFLPQG